MNKVVLVTGAAGFIGRNLIEALHRNATIEVIAIDIQSAPELLANGLARADVIYHLAGVNRPKDEAEFVAGNTGFTEWICDEITARGRKPVLVMTSSIQAVLENPYGVSKLNAERALERWVTRHNGCAIIFRLKNVFGKWCRPNYNSVTATFCHNIAHDLPITISDPARELELVYIDDVITALTDCLEVTSATGLQRHEIKKFHRTTLGGLADNIRAFRTSRTSLVMPSFDDEFTRRLYATYLSYLDVDCLQYNLNQKSDSRGCLAEFMKSVQFGQIFVSRTKSGVTRGNHYHHTKTEKFLVVEGEALIRFRQVEGTDVKTYRVSGADFSVVDIPPGYVHSIENVGSGELVTLFWASEIFDSAAPDCYFSPVLQPK